MKQHEMDRKYFWNNSGEVKEELADYLKVVQTEREEEFSIIDGWYTLFCC